MSDDATTITDSSDDTVRGHESEASENLLSENDVEILKKKHTGKRKRQPNGDGHRRHGGSRRAEGPDLIRSASSEGDDSNEDIPEELPDYLRRRRENFERRKTKLKDVGLRLPPNYDNVDFSDDENLENVKEKPDFPNTTPKSPYKDVSLPYSLGVIPASIVQWLREYQITGAAFLHELFVYQTGGILGDDMGLGKTIQVISFLTAAFGKTGDERDIKRMRKVRRSGAVWYPRVLIVCPGTLFENWQAEFKRWGYWHVDVYHGDTKEDAIQAAKAGRIEIMMTSYATYRLDMDIINMIEWDCVIADEFHQIKNRYSSTTKAMNQVNSLCRIGLTGTAIQNSYDELWTLLNWTNPGVFGPIYDWKKMISVPLRQGQSHSASVQELGEARKVAKQLTQNLLPNFFLRRMKALIAHQLPKKTDRVVFCPLTAKQADAYENFLDSEIVEHIKTSTDMCDCGSKKKRGWCCYMEIRGERWQSFVFPAISTLQKVSNHLAMLIPQDGDPKEKQDKDLNLLQDALPSEWREIFRNKASMAHYANTDHCGKWRVLKKLLRFWHENGDKVLVFSHSVRLLKMLRLLFQNTSYNVSFLDGSMSLEDRAKEVDNFNADPEQFVFLISTKAGGVGLNITSANKVVIFDPNWNPSYDLQAQDRAYRIGQTRDVEVFRLVSIGTVEEIVYARQIYKQQQANIGYTASKERRYFTGIQEKKDQKGEIFGLANLFAYQGENIVLRDIVNKTNVAESRAGVAIAGIDSSQADNEEDPLLNSQDDDENGAMSQLAELVAEGGTKTKSRTARAGRSTKTDPVQAILAQAGVEYTHENSEVVGSSRIETKLSRQAERTENHGTKGKEQVFQDDETAKHGSDHHDPDQDLANARWRYNPPLAIRKRQFCTMAKTFGFEDPTEYALVVESWTQAQRRNCLDRFYAKRRALLKSAEAQDESNEESVIQTDVPNDGWAF